MTFVAKIMLDDREILHEAIPELSVLLAESILNFRAKAKEASGFLTAFVFNEERISEIVIHEK